MDSVLTYLVDSSIDPVLTLQKSLKKKLNYEHLYLFRDLDHSFMTLINSLKLVVGGEVIISALAPYSLFKVIESCGLVPVVADVDLDTGLVTSEYIDKKITENTVLILNTFNYAFNPPYEGSMYNGINGINIYLSGLIADSEGNIITGPGEYNLVSLENNTLINTMGGVFLTCKEDSCDFINEQLKIRPSLRLQGLNASFANSQIADLDSYLDKQRQLIKIYKNSLLKSGYYTFDTDDNTTSNMFPVVVKKSLKDIQKYCRSHGVEGLRTFNDSIVKQSSVKAVNAKSLSNRTILFPLTLSLKKESVKLISKILSTLP